MRLIMMMVMMSVIMVGMYVEDEHVTEEVELESDDTEQWRRKKRRTNDQVNKYIK